jgi:predicted transcriptional regulator
MLIKQRKITIVKISRPQHVINDELQWFGNSFDLFGERDKDKSCFRIFIELLKATKKQAPVSSDELAAKLNLSRGTVVYHLNKLIESGIVIVVKNKYILRGSSLQELVDEIEADALNSMRELRRVAKEIDEGMR